MSGKTIKKVLLKPDDVLQDLPYFTFKGHCQSNFSSPDTVQLTDGTPILLSRTGYTGEFGFEIFVDPLHLVKVWEMLLESGFVKVKKKLETGQTLFLQDDRRTIRVRVVKDIRPHRTARRAITEMI